VLVLGRVLLVRCSLEPSLDSPSAGARLDPVVDFTVVDDEVDEGAVVADSVSLAGPTLTGGVPGTVVGESSLACVEVAWTAAARADAAEVETDVGTLGTVSVPTSGP
jgi:hypothetical protein